MNHEALDGLRNEVTWRRLSGDPFDGPSSPRMARLRNLALDQVESDLVSFLDDDNYVEPDHFASLEAQLVGAAAYSWRRIEDRDGYPFDGSWYPWHPNSNRSAELHRWCLDAGVFDLGSDIVRDGPVDSADPRNVATVDMNEWLFRTSVLRSIGFAFDFSPDEIANQVGEDDKLLAGVLDAGLSITCTRRPTVRYRLGGVSNHAAARDRQSQP